MAQALWMMVLLGAALFSLAVVFATHIAVRVVQRRPDPPARTPAISILKPLRGVEPGLFENLSSFARQDYPRFEIVLGCENPDDPALAVAARLAHDFPRVPMRIVSGAAAFGYNPKVNNLRNLERTARHEVLLISDADVRVAPDYLRRMAAQLAEPGTGLVVNGVSGEGERSIGAALENLQLTGFVSGSICSAAVALGRPIVIGKSMLFRRRDLATIGGWDSIADVLAEDFVFGDRIERLGLRIALCPYFVPVINRQRGVQEFWARHVRWAQMRRHIVPHLYVLEPLMLPTPWLFAVLLADFSSSSGAGTKSAFALLGLLLRIASDALLLRRVRGAALRPGWAWLSLAKDLLGLAAWSVALFRVTVDWRGTILRIGPGSSLGPAGAASETLPATAQRV